MSRRRAGFRCLIRAVRCIPIDSPPRPASRSVRVRASRFETRHPTLLHLLIVGAAWATYLADRDDIVWRIIRSSPSSRALERAAFSVTALLIGAGALFCTRARTSNGRARLLGEWLYALGLATLLPLWGSVFLLAAESIRLARLALAQREQPPLQNDREPWKTAIRRESVKWGIFATMIVFSVCLIDRVADYGILASLLAWAVLAHFLPCERARLLQSPGPR